jgi:exopolysaccharide production protein ExoZ
MRHYFHNLQALRGVACLMVVFGHLGVWDNRFGWKTVVLREVQLFGFAGVDLFFVLSGFILTYVHAADAGRLSAVPQFLARRLWRIVPPYWAAMVFCAVVLPLAVGTSLGTLGWDAGWPHWIFLVPGGPSNPLAIPSWTLAYEMMFYLVLGMGLALPRRAMAALLIAWAVAVLASQVWLNTDFAALSPFVLEFLAGCGIAGLLRSGVNRFGRSAMVAGLAWSAVAGAIVRANTSGDWGAVMSANGLRVLVFGPAAALLVYGVAACRTIQAPRWLVYVGEASYSIYLTHFPVQTLGVVVGLNMSHSRGPHLIWLAGTMFATLVVGFMFHRRVEQPLLKWGHCKPKPIAPEAPAPVRHAA